MSPSRVPFVVLGLSSDCACCPAHAFLFSCVALVMVDQSAPDLVGPTSPLYGFFSSDVVSDIPQVTYVDIPFTCAWRSRFRIV